MFTQVLNTLLRLEYLPRGACEKLLSCKFYKETVNHLQWIACLVKWQMLNL